MKSVMKSKDALVTMRKLKRMGKTYHDNEKLMHVSCIFKPGYLIGQNNVGRNFSKLTKILSKESCIFWLFYWTKV